MLTGSKEEIKSYASGMISRRTNLMFILTVVVLGPSLLIGFIGLIAFNISRGLGSFLGLLGMCGAVAIPVLVLVLVRRFYRSAARREISELREKEKNAVDQCLEVLAQPSYFNAASGVCGGAIAVAPATGKISLVFGRMLFSQPVNTQLITLQPGELRSWSAEKPGVTTSKLTGRGHSASEIMANNSYNSEHLLEQALGTGLRLGTENLHATEVFLNFDFEVAKSWVALLSKLDAGRLETLTVSTEFPNPEKSRSP